jgi:hypothetical protein
VLGTLRNLGLGIARSLGDKRYTYPKKKCEFAQGIFVGIVGNLSLN